MSKQMPETVVVNVRNLLRTDFDIYIGRWNPRFRKEPNYKWGNPFSLKDGTREEVIAKYEAYIRSRPDLMASLPELIGKRLGCWCKPLSCHGDVLVKLVHELEQKPYKPFQQGV